MANVFAIVAEAELMNRWVDCHGNHQPFRWRSPDVACLQIRIVHLFERMEVIPQRISLLTGKSTVEPKCGKMQVRVTLHINEPCRDIPKFVAASDLKMSL
jgi:hypothetical protein